MKKFIITIHLMLLVGCSFLDQKNEYTDNSTLTKRDYLDHYKSIGVAYLNSSDVIELKLDSDSKKYLQELSHRVISNNEILLSLDHNFNFHVIKNSSPFLFSLPGGEIFFSSGLFEKHLKSEDLFVAAFSAEILKSSKNIYEKKAMIPLGFISTEKILQLTRVPAETKRGINEWSYVILKRAGFDASAYLNWIQVQNRNSLDFALYLGDLVSISSEEQQFKNFMTKQGIASLERKVTESNSSKEFYKLIKNISREANETRTIRKNPSRRTF